MSEASAKTLFRKNLVRVLTMQVVALLALWLLQTLYTR